MLLPGTDSQQASAIAESIRSTIEALRVPHEGNDGGVVTVSIGVATAAPAAGKAASRLVEAADGAVYRAKKAGRNQVAVA